MGFLCVVCIVDPQNSHLHLRDCVARRTKQHLRINCLDHTIGKPRVNTAKMLIATIFLWLITPPLTILAEEPMVRRVYDNPVRAEVRKMEERMEKYRTGWNTDPFHAVDYDNHPYEQRRLSSNSTIFQPMRISFYTKALDDIRDESNAAKIDWSVLCFRKIFD